MNNGYAYFMLPKNQVRERDSSSVHQHLHHEVGPLTCGKPVVLKIPVERVFNVERIT